MNHSQAMMGNKNASRSTEDKIRTLAEKRWPEMIEVLDSGEVDDAFDIFVATLHRARQIKLP